MASNNLIAWPCLIAAALLLSACEQRDAKSAASPAADSASSDAASPSQGPLIIELLDVPDVGSSLVEGAPKVSVVEQQLTQALSTVSALKLKPGQTPQANPSLTLRFIMEFKRQDDPSGAQAPLIFMRWSCKLLRFPADDSRGELPSDGELLARQLIVPGLEQDLGEHPGVERVDSLEKLTAAATTTCASSLDGQLRLARASDEELPKLLEEGLVGAAAQIGLQRAREANNPAAAKPARAYLSHHNPQLVLAAAGALVQLKDKEAAAPMIEAATQLSAANNLRDLRALLYLLGELGGQQVIPYLEAVATGHANPEIKESAAQALATARKKG